jgi:hypothetical protein
MRDLLIAGHIPRLEGLNGPVVVMVGRVAKPGQDAELHLMRLADLLSLQAARCRGSGLAAWVDGLAYAVLPAGDTSVIATRLRNLAARTGLRGVLLAVSRPVAHDRPLDGARREAELLLGLLDGHGGADVQVRFAEDCHDQLLLLEIARAVSHVDGIQAGVVERIATYDVEHATQYESSLRAWFEALGDVTAAAALLHIHANTLRYRLARAVDIFGLRLDLADARLLLHLELRVRTLAPTADD